MVYNPQNFPNNYNFNEKNDKRDEKKGKLK